MKASIALGIESGTLNDALAEELKAKGCDPFEIMARLALEGEDDGIKLGAAKELAKYLRPQLKSVDIKVGNNAQRKFAIVKFSDVDPVKAAALVKGLTPAALTAAIVPDAGRLDAMRRELEKPALTDDEMTVVTEEAVEPLDDDVPDEYPGAKYRYK